jgi:cytosine/adenosine deaminase-related metal-dependent hydrolase
VTGKVHRATWVLPVEGDPIEDGEVAVELGRIVAVGRDLTETAAAQGFWVVDHDGVLLPGLVNAHAHLVYGPAFADLATSGLPFEQWITELLPRRRAMTAAELTAQARASAELAIAAGTTAVADVASHVDTLPVLAETGLGGIAYYELAGADPTTWTARRARWETELQQHPHAGISPHTLYTLDDDVMRDLTALARRTGRRLHPHVAETQSESEWVLTGTGPYQELNERFSFAMALAGTGSGRSPVQHLDALGGLGPDVHVAHGVHVDADDRKLLRHRGTAVALCTRSNAILGSGRAPVAAYRQEGSPVAVGTDSLASSPDLDLLAELRALEKLARDQGSPDAGLDRWLVEAATVGGARAMGIAAGVLAPGTPADFVIVQGEGDDPYEQVVHGRATATYLKGTRR